MRNCLSHFEDISGLLREEFETTDDLNNGERQLLLNCLEKWESGVRLSAIDVIEQVLKTKEGYRKTLADCIVNTRMKGRPAEDY
jgi:hypothetical protein